MYYFTSDEHYGHRNIIKYCNRPFQSVEEMDEELIKRHNEVVKDGDTVIHGGDFTLLPTKARAEKYIKRLNGYHIFLSGSHDRWLGRKHPLQIWERKFNGQLIVVCHYAMHVWSQSHYGSFMLYGHSHAGLSHTSKEPVGKVWDIGVDNNNFYPLSLDQIFDIMKSRPNNWNLKG